MTDEQIAPETTGSINPEAAETDETAAGDFPDRTYLDERHIPLDEDDRRIAGVYEVDGHFLRAAPKGKSGNLHVQEISEREYRLDVAFTKMVKGLSFEDVKVVRRRGTVTIAQHDMAREFPTVSREMFESIADDVEARGFDNPVDLDENDLVFDGRSRVAVAWALHIPLPVRPFEGDEAGIESKALAGNLLRRHLSPAAVAALSLKYVVPALSEEAAARKVAGVKSDASGRTADKAAALSGGAFSPTTLKRLRDLPEAPETFKRVVTGELTSVPEIRDTMEAEIRAALSPSEKAARTKAYAKVDEAAAKTRMTREAKAEAERLRAAQADSLMDEIEVMVQKFVDAMYHEDFGKADRSTLVERASAVCDKFVEIMPTDVEPEPTEDES